MEAAVDRELSKLPDSDPDSWDTSDADSEGKEAAGLPEAAAFGAQRAAAAPLHPAVDEGAESDADSGAAADVEDEEDERRGSHAHASGSDAGEEEGAAQKGGGSGAGDNKAASFARAFAKIMATGDAGRGILSASKSVSKRKREDAALDVSERDAKNLRREMRQRGHGSVPKRGEDPERDAREKALSRLATRGVVRLFNAVAKAQRAQKEAEAEGAKAGQAAKLSKASFLAELRGQRQRSTQQPAQAAGEQLLPLKPAAQGASAAAQACSGWSVLQDGLVGAKGTGTRLKDWDQAADSSEEEDEGLGLHDDGGDSDSE